MSHFPIPEWAAQVDNAQFTDPALVQSRAARFERTIKRRNIIEYAAGALAAALFGAFAVGAAAMGEYLFAAAGALCIACVAVVLWQLNARGSYRPSPPEASCLEHLRAQYQRQYEALRSVPRWYLGPLAFALLGFYAAFAYRFAQVGGWEKAFEGLWQPVALTAAFFVFVGALNLFAARGLKRQIDQIDALKIDALDHAPRS